LKGFEKVCPIFMQQLKVPRLHAILLIQTNELTSGLWKVGKNGAKNNCVQHQIGLKSMKQTTEQYKKKKKKGEGEEEKTNVWGGKKVIVLGGGRGDSVQGV